MNTRSQRVLALLPLLAAALLAGPAAGQAIFGTAGDGNLAVAFPNPSGLPNPAQTTVTGLPANAQPHGVSPLDTDRAIVSDFGNSRLFVVRISTSQVLSTIDAGATFNGTGTIALNPAGDALLCSGSAVSGGNLVSSAAVVRNPRTTPAVQALRVSGVTRSYQTQGIVFDATGRAFVSHTNGISVLDPPYTSEAFVIAIPNPSPSTPVAGALAITPDGTTLLHADFYDSNGATSGGNGRVRVIRAPFSASNTGVLLPIPGGEGLDGVAVTPDGQKALVASAWSPKVWAISAPFGEASAVEEIPLPADFRATDAGFEDISISVDGQLALITGNSARDSETGAGGRLPALFLKAPFTRAGAQPFAVTVGSGDRIGRGAGSGRFVACEAPAAPVSLAVRPQGNASGPVTATDYLDLSWQPSTAGTPPTRYEWRINGDAYQSTTSHSVQGAPPRGRTDLVNLFVRGYACSPEKGPGPEAKSADYSMARPVASFTASATSVRVGETVTFTDTSSPQATSWIWFFGNSAACETCQNPSLAFSTPGTYGVVLLATNGSGTSASATTFVTVTSSGPPGARLPAFDETPPVLETEESLRFGPRARPTLWLSADEDAVVWLQLRTRSGELLAERRVVLTPGERTRLELGAYVPVETRERLDVRLVSDRPVRALFQEEHP